MSLRLYVFAAIFSILHISVCTQSVRDGPNARNAGVYIENNATRIDRQSPPDFLYRDISISRCLCSPTTRGHPPLDSKVVVKFLAAVKAVQNTKFTDLLRASRERLADYAAEDVVKQYSNEGLVNLDATLRDKGSIVYCVYLKNTSKILPNRRAAEQRNVGKNIGLWRNPPGEAQEYVTLKPCDKVNATRASDEIAKMFVKPAAAASMKKEL